jgi:hypothetical protein
MNRLFRPGDLVYHQRLGRGTIVEQWGCWTAVEPDSGKTETINGANIYEVEFETGGRRSVSSCRLRPIDFAGASVLCKLTGIQNERERGRDWRHCHGVRHSDRKGGSQVSI